MERIQCPICRKMFKDYGYNIIHHIKGWKQYPELRYKVKNGITLCQHHHPKRRIDERKMIPIFKKLVLSK